MDLLAVFLGRLLREGRVAFDRPPAPAERLADSAEAVATLREAFRIRSLEVAGTPIAFDAEVAARAGEVVRQACWALVCREDRPEQVGRRVAMPGRPRSASEHLSADLTLRFLPGVYRRARGIDPGDPLVEAIEGIFRAWPLSGVLAGLDEGPASPPDLAGHAGLMLLYAERFAIEKRSEWRPAEGPASDYVELVAGGEVR
jgi:hypothetical protein